MSPRQQRGFSLAEYTIVAGVVIAALIIPMPTDVAPFNGRSLMVTLIEAIQILYANFAYGIGLPRIR